MLEGVKCNGRVVLEGNVPAVCAGGDWMAFQHILLPHT